LSLLSVADVMQDPLGKPLRLPGLRLAYSGRDARVFRNSNALPRVFLVDRQRTVGSESAAFAAITGPPFDARHVAVTERPLPGLPQDRGGTARAGAGAADLVLYQPERVVARAVAQRASLLVLTDVYYPGWKASVDGHSAPLQRVDYLLRGVLVPPGGHTIELRYEPASWRAGWIVSVLALGVVAILLLLGWRSRRIARVTSGDAPVA
jgi:Bacterial membrane protein YfhO